MKTNRTKHSPGFKAKVALAAVREQETIGELSRRYKIHVNQVGNWKRQLFDKASLVFEAGNDKCSEFSEREAELLKKIGELTVERDFLSQGLGRCR